MTERDLDRLISKTAMNPLARQTLRYVRTAVIEGQAGEPVVSERTWAVAIMRRSGLSVTFTFPLKES